MPNLVKRVDVLNNPYFQEEIQASFHEFSHPVGPEDLPDIR